MSDLIQAVQQRISIPRLIAPAPGPEHLQTLLSCAVRAPDHGRMRPWRFVVMQGEALVKLGLAFEQAGLAGDPAADDSKRARWRDMPLRAPMVIAAIAQVKPNPKVPDWEQLVAVGCAVQNIQLAAWGLGYGTMWRTGDMTVAPAVKQHLDMAGNDRVVAFLYIGTPDGEARGPDFQPLEQCVEYRSYWIIINPCPGLKFSLGRYILRASCGSPERSPACTDSRSGEVSERLKEHAWKVCVR